MRNRGLQMLLILLFAWPASAQTFTVLRTFEGPAFGDGQSPVGIVLDAAGNIYGETALGGALFGGTIFKLTPSGQYSILFNFDTPLDAGSPLLFDGGLPNAQLVLDKHGNIFGTAEGGGPENLGTIFELHPNGHVTVLYGFTKGTDSNHLYPNGIFPDQGLVRDSAGNFYGVTSFGGNPVGAGGACFFAGGFVQSGCGTVFKLDPTTDEQTIVHAFNFNDGSDPWQTLVQDATGNIYGVTQSGGIGGNCHGGCGVLFRIDTTGRFKVLHHFTGAGGSSPFPTGAAGTTSTAPPDGQSPTAVTIDPSTGDIYGTTFLGGSGGAGVIFKLDKRGKYSILHNFVGPEGAFGASSLILHNGELYGAAFGGGDLKLCVTPLPRPSGPQGGCGVLFAFDLATNKMTTLHVFHNKGDGQAPGFLIMDAEGNLLGTTQEGGAVGDPDKCAKFGCGTLFKFTP
jgi:uncharacterized repeat protein (TIGR03803 family)